MIQITVLHSGQFSESDAKNFEQELQEDLRSDFPFHEVVAFFLSAKSKVSVVSIEVRVVSKKGISKEEAQRILNVLEEKCELLKEQKKFQGVSFAIHIAPWLQLEHVKWIE